ncbi:photosystem I assembly protein ycf4 [[Synechococcus] sp. NIES-970]|uniref:photosystem I assembly protein Ycf4 n=1 Tax=Picosynechococcus sp. NKBG15041c TaxID=1407650 RepID=UPI000464E69F|nr:photosystem I assembly protein Ycf4 [Picosynechococcus sp. NKBG15041c]BAW95989.1 photosystem I assembly protein ycf4 [[Synechococcus] sp. NIES-970]
MAAQVTTSTDSILRQPILGSRRFSNMLWASVSAIGGIGFLLAGLSSYFHQNFLLVSDPSDIQFIPQGAALTFYGVAGTLLSAYLWFVFFLNVGGGYNEFNKETGKVTIFRYGFVGKNRIINFQYSLKDILSIRAEIKEGLNPRRVLYLRVKNRGDIPLNRVGEPIPLAELENQGAELARFLTIPLEGL